MEDDTETKQALFPFYRTPHTLFKATGSCVCRLHTKARWRSIANGWFQWRAQTIFMGVFHSVAYGGHLFVVCSLCDVTIWGHIHVSKV